VILDDFKTALDSLRMHWMRKKNGELFVTPLTTPNNSPQRYRVRGDLEAFDSLVTSAKSASAHAVHMDDVHLRDEIPDIPLRR
jgi:hypothetical protein